VLAGRDAFAQGSATEGDSSQAAQQAAMRLIPYDQLNPQAQAKLSSVIQRPTIFRRLPVQTVGCDPDLYVFLVRYPEVIVNIWNLMEVSEAQLKRTAAYSFTLNDGGGTISGVELLYGRSDLHVFYAEGYYDGPMLRRRLNGKCVMLLSTSYQKGADGKPLATHQMDVFLQLEQSGFELMARTLFPLVSKNTDQNFIQTSQFLARISTAAESNSPGVGRMSEKLSNCDPAVREQFAKLATQVGHRAIMRNGAATDQAAEAIVNRAAARSPR